MAMVKPRGKVSKRNIVLKIETYKRLEKFLLELMEKRGSPRVTFDEAVNALLDEYYKKGGGQGLMELNYKLEEYDICRLYPNVNVEKAWVKAITASGIVRRTKQGWEIDTKKIEMEDVYYAFKIDEDVYFAKKEQNTIRVYEAYIIEENKAILIPIFEVKV